MSINGRSVYVYFGLENKISKSSDNARINTVDLKSTYNLHYIIITNMTVGKPCVTKGAKNKKEKSYDVWPNLRLNEELH